MTEQFMENISNEEHERLLLLCGHGIGDPLSPAAQAVLNAAMQYEINPECYSRDIAAAALRAAAEKIEELYCESDVDSSEGVVFALRQLVLIASELEGASD